MRNVLSFLFLLQVSTTLLASSAASIPQEGKYGLQDLEGDVGVMVVSRTLSVSELHKNLCAPERELKKRTPSKSTINFVLAKINVYKDDGFFYEQNIHEMMGLEGCRVDEDVTTLIPHRPGRAQLTHPVLHAAVSLGLEY